jgi:hypothetical protein
VHTLDRARAVVRSYESINPDALRRLSAGDEVWAARSCGAYDVQVVGVREPCHAPAAEWASLELVLDDEDALDRRAPRGANVRESWDAPKTSRDEHARTLRHAALTAHKDQGCSGIK